MFCKQRVTLYERPDYHRTGALPILQRMGTCARRALHGDAGSPFLQTKPPPKSLGHLNQSSFSGSMLALIGVGIRFARGHLPRPRLSTPLLDSKDACRAV